MIVFLLLSLIFGTLSIGFILMKAVALYRFKQELSKPKNSKVNIAIDAWINSPKNKPRDMI